MCIFDPERCHGYRTTWMLLLAPHEGCSALCVVGLVRSSLATQLTTEWEFLGMDFRHGRRDGNGVITLLPLLKMPTR